MIWRVRDKDILFAEKKLHCVYRDEHIALRRRLFKNYLGSGSSGAPRVVLDGFHFNFHSPLMCMEPMLPPLPPAVINLVNVLLA